MANQSAGGGVSFAGLLTVAFVVLKLTGKIDWSWWWVLSPVWAPFAFVLAVLVVAACVSLANHLRITRNGR